jgi:hypothetical protein
LVKAGAGQDFLRWVTAWRCQRNAKQHFITF